MNRDELEQRVWEVSGALASTDPAVDRSMFAPDFVWHVPGDSPVAGTYRGEVEYFETRVQRMAPMDEWSLTVNRVIANPAARSALVLFRLTGVRKGLRAGTDGYHVVRFNPEGLVEEGFSFVEDQDALDVLFSA